MQWTEEAEDTIKKVPFFVRKRVRARVENEARRKGKPLITLDEVKATQQRYLTGMASEIKGYQLDTCFGTSGCPNVIQSSDRLLSDIETLLKEADLRAFLKSKHIKKLKFHHEFRVTVADCPNACSQPQIKDIGILGASVPRTTDELCNKCGACVLACHETAIRLDGKISGPEIITERCVVCGQCARACPTGTLAEGVKGYRVQLGGKLGRHPRLAVELPGVYDQSAVMEIVKACLTLYKTKNEGGERFGDMLTQADLEMLTATFASRNLDQ